MNFRCSLLVGPRCVFFVKTQVTKSSELPSYIDHQLKNSKKTEVAKRKILRLPAMILRPVAWNKIPGWFDLGGMDIQGERKNSMSVCFFCLL